MLLYVVCCVIYCYVMFCYITCIELLCCNVLYYCSIIYFVVLCYIKKQFLAEPKIHSVLKKKSYVNLRNKKSDKKKVYLVKY